MNAFPSLENLPKKRCKVIMLHSQKGGPGKSTLSINIAYQLAKFGKKTLVIDLDIAQPCLRDILNISPDSISFTINDVLLGKEYDVDKLLIKTAYDNLYAVVADHNVSYGKGLLGLMKKIHDDSFFHLHELLKSLHQYGYEYAILDCAPGYRIEAISSAIIADARIFVIKPSTFSFEGAKQLLNNIYKKFSTTAVDFLIFSQIPPDLSDEGHNILEKWKNELILRYKPNKLHYLGQIPLSSQLISNAMFGNYIIEDEELSELIYSITRAIETKVAKL